MHCELQESHHPELITLACFLQSLAPGGAPTCQLKDMKFLEAVMQVGGVAETSYFPCIMLRHLDCMAFTITFPGHVAPATLEVT